MSSAGSNRIAKKGLVPKGLGKIKRVSIGVNQTEFSDIDVVYEAVEKMGKNFGIYLASRLSVDDFSANDVIRIYAKCKNKFVYTYSSLIFENLNKLTDRRSRNKALRNLVRISEGYIHPPF